MRSIFEYVEEFHWLNAKTRINKSENYHIARFVDGLKEEIQQQMDLQLISTQSAAVSMIYKAEIKMEKR